MTSSAEPTYRGFLSLTVLQRHLCVGEFCRITFCLKKNNNIKSECLCAFKCVTWCVWWVLKVTVRTALHRALHKTGWFVHILCGKKNVESNFYLIVYNKCPHFKKVMHIICELQPCPVYTYNPETIYRNFRVKISDAVFPPLSGVWVREVRKGCWAWPNLRIQNMTTPHFQIKKNATYILPPTHPNPISPSLSGFAL